VDDSFPLDILCRHWGHHYCQGELTTPRPTPSISCNVAVSHHLPPPLLGVGGTPPMTIFSTPSMMQRYESDYGLPAPPRTRTRTRTRTPSPSLPPSECPRAAAGGCRLRHTPRASVPAGPKHACLLGSWRQRRPHRAKTRLARGGSENNGVG
jgi:hypothetical protein